MSGNLNKIIFLFVGLFLTFLLVAFILGRFNLRPKTTPALSGSLREALGFRPIATVTPTPISLAGSAPSVLLPTKTPSNQNGGVVLGQTNPTPDVVEMRYTPPVIPNTGVPSEIILTALSMFGGGVYLVRKGRD